jgi:predicted TPR repeat methyltransferase
MGGNEEDRRQRAIMHHRAGRLDEAEELYGELLSDAPDDAVLLELSGVLAAQKGETDDAREKLERALQAAPDRSSAHENLGNLHQLEGRLDEALAAYARAAELDPESASIQYNLGTVLGRTYRHEEAAAAYRRSLDLDQGRLSARYNLARSLMSLGIFDEAEEQLREVIRSAPEDPDGLMSLGELLGKQKRFSEAVELHRAAIELDPSKAWLEHFVSAYRGDTTERPPDDYVPGLFDGFARRYDEHLALLDFRAPAELKRIIAEYQPSHARFRRALDLGCGTGLAGLEIRPLVEELWGVDLSPKMLERARERGIYDRLSPGSIDGFLERAEATFDLFIASDVFTYQGNLEAFFRAVRSRAAETGLFAFTTEVSESRDFVLRTTGRYAHSRPYIETLATECSFEVVHASTAPLRLDFEEMLPGYYFLLRLV